MILNYDAKSVILSTGLFKWVCSEIRTPHYRTRADLQFAETLVQSEPDGDEVPVIAVL